jgi:nucleotide-binding universal stress UspA family protein
VAGKIIVGFDGTESAKVALDWALRRAEATDQEVEVVYVADTSWDSAAFTAAPALEQHGQVVLAGEQFTIDSKQSDVPITTRVLSGHPVAVLCEEAETSGADLLVVGNYRKDAYERLTTSSVSLKVAAGAKVPVAVVPDLADVQRKGVVVGIDGSEASGAILEFAAGEAERLGEDLHVVSAWTLPPMSVPEFSDNADIYNALEERANSVVTEAIAALAPSHPSLTITPHVELDSPVAALVHAAKDARLLVLGSHGRRGVSRFLLGSVSHDVLLHAPAPVIVLRVA